MNNATEQIVLTFLDEVLSMEEKKQVVTLCDKALRRFFDSESYQRDLAEEVQDDTYFDAINLLADFLGVKTDFGYPETDPF